MKSPLVAKRRAKQEVSPTLQRPRGIWQCVYWTGRLLQGLGLVLIWWVLLLFVNTTDMAALLYGSVAAAIMVFYLGWVCTAWAKKHTMPAGR